MLVCAASVQSINLTGKVTNTGGKGLEGAVVTLMTASLKDTTDANGNYTISDGQAQVTPSLYVPNVGQISMNRGVIRFSMTESAPVKVALFDMKGNLVRQVIRHTLAAGDYRYDLSTDMVAAGMLVVRITVGARGATFRYLPVDGSNAGETSSNSLGASVINSLGKLQATVDSLKIEKTGYMPKTIAVPSLDGTIDVELDTLSLDKFSFFVTSMAALLDLSKSADGFGGNFSFGKSGPGAGLKGADSICECIAERSMPGSKVKKWRAFLSVKADENGKQVDAVDRIGTGPWYDRIGRLVAPTLTDLMNERPENGDATIANDLPNEDGIPNHRPDPAKPDVDNHHMVTGSGTDGKLYTGANATTCDDWTSTTASGRPQCGFAWPRPRAGTYWWMSGFSAGGCKAGIEIIQNGGGTPGSTIIGKGGGYGGFYCFALVP
jgi:hypothetical protein